MLAAELDVATKVLYNLAHIYVPTHPGYCTIRTHCCISDLNTSTELLVKTTLFDRVAWHKSWYDSMRKTKAPLSANTISPRFHAKSKKVCNTLLELAMSIYFYHHLGMVRSNFMAPPRS